MSTSQLVDGKTGQPIGYNTYGNNTGYVATTTSNYVPAATTTTTTNYVYGSGSGSAAGSSYPVGATNAAYTTNAGNAYTTNAATTYTTNTATAYPATGYYTTTQNYATSAGVPTTTTVTTGNAQIVGTTVNTGKEVIKGESRIQYVPFEKKIIEYKDQATVERVPKKTKKQNIEKNEKFRTFQRRSL